MLRKFSSLLLVLIMVVGALPTVSFAADWTNHDAFGQDIFFDDFENGLDTTNKWNKPTQSNSALVQIETVPRPSDSDNKAVILDTTKVTESGEASLVFSSTKGLVLDSDVIVEFDLLILSSGESNRDIMEYWRYTTAAKSGGTLFRMYNDGKIGGYNSAKNAYVKSTKSAKDGWCRLRFIIEPDRGSYTMYVDNELLVKDSLTKSSNTMLDATFKQVRFQITTGNATTTKGNHWKIAIDNFKIARYLGFYNGQFTDGTAEIVSVNNGTNKFEADIMNNSSFDTKATLILAAYSERGSVLEKVIAVPVDIKANSAAEAVASLDGIDPSWDIKAFFVDNMDNITPFRKSFGDVYDELPATAQAVASIRTVEVSSAGYDGVTATYPDGKYKAVTVRCDDGYASDKKLIEIFNSAGIKGTFYICEKNITGASNRLSVSELKPLYLDNGHEIANHTANHLKLNAVIDADVDSDAKYTFDPYIKDDIKNGIDWIEETLDIDVNGFTAPYSSLYDAAGLAYLAETGHTYAVRNHRNTPLSDAAPFALPDITNHYDIRATIRDMIIDKDNNDAINYARAYRALNPDEMTLFFSWGHSGDFNQYGVGSTAEGYPKTGNSDIPYGWDFAKELYETLGGAADIWYATNGDVFHYLFAHDDADITETASSARIYNPSEAITLWFDLGSEVIQVAPLETVIIKTI